MSQIIAETRYGIDLRVQLGIGRQASRGTWDAGAWDIAVWGQTDTALGDWVDVTCDVADPFKLAAGASDVDGIVTRWEAATLGMTLYGDAYDPWGGPYAGVVGPGVAVRVLWRPQTAPPQPILPPEVPEYPGWHWAFMGLVSAGGWEFAPARAGSGIDETRISATDTTQVLAAYDAVATDPPVGAGEDGSARVIRILNMAYWADFRRDVTPGGIPMRATNLEGSAWEQLLTVADTDLALLWVTRGGYLAYRPAGRVGEGVNLASRLVMCDDGTNPEDVQYVTLGGATFGAVKNVVSVSHARDEGASSEPPVTTVRDDASAARFGTRRYTRTDLVYADTEEWWAKIVADSVLLSSSWPSAAPRDVTLDSRLGDPAVPVLLLALEPEHAFDVVDTRGRTWRQGTRGWSVEVGRSHIAGTIALDDIGRWVAGTWDSGGWDRDRWGFIIPGA